MSKLEYFRILKILFFYENYSFSAPKMKKNYFLSEKSSLGELKVSVSEWHIGERMDITRINYKI